MPRFWFSLSQVTNRAVITVVLPTPPGPTEVVTLTCESDGPVSLLPSSDPLQFSLVTYNHPLTFTIVADELLDDAVAEYRFSVVCTASSTLQVMVEC